MGSEVRSWSWTYNAAGQVVSMTNPNGNVTSYTYDAHGDLASINSDGKPVPGLSPAAIQEGRHAAKNIMRSMRGEPTLPFHYRDKGTLATIGKAAAVADIAGLHLSGLIAWLTWLFVHILFLIGFRNRFTVMVEWAWTYLSNDRGARLITGDVEPLLERGEKIENRERMLSK